MAPMPPEVGILMTINRKYVAPVIAVLTGPSLQAFGDTDPSLSNWGFGAHMSGGYAFEGVEGAEFEIAGALKYKDWLRVNLIPLNIVLSEDEDSPFFNDTFSNGQSRCRDSRNGQFVDDAECGPDIDYRGAAEAQFLLADRFWFGGGAVIGEGASPFATAGVTLTKNFGLYARIGDEYAAAQLRLVF